MLRRTNVEPRNAYVKGLWTYLPVVFPGCTDAMGLNGLTEGLLLRGEPGSLMIPTRFHAKLVSRTEENLCLRDNISNQPFLEHAYFNRKHNNET